MDHIASDMNKGKLNVPLFHRRTRSNANQTIVTLQFHFSFAASEKGFCGKNVVV
jgi:hypothetical protein